MMSVLSGVLTRKYYRPDRPYFDTLGLIKRKQIPSIQLVNDRISIWIHE